jgi:uroporphyrinogen decarboxylase
MAAYTPLESRTMNSIERVRAVFDHREPDRIPIYEQGIASDVASRILGRPAYTGSTSLWRDEAEAWLRGDQAHDEFVHQVEEDTFELYTKLQMDVISLPWRRAAKPTRKIEEFAYLYGDPDPDGDCELMRYDPFSDSCGIERHCKKPPCAEDVPAQVRQQLAAFEKRAKPTEGSFAGLVALKKRAGDRFEVFGGGGMGIPMQPHWLEAALLYPEAVRDHLDMQAQANIESFEVLARLGFRVIWGGGDFASNHGPVYSPAVFRSLMLPALKRKTSACHRLGLKYVFRTDGNLWPIAREFFVESGIHGYGEIDIDAGMDLRKLKKLHPHLTLWGGLSCGRLLRLGTPEAVRAETLDILEKVGRGGGLLFGSSNIIMQGTPVENVYACIDTVMSCGRRP